MSLDLIQRLIERFGPVALKPRTGLAVKEPTQTGSSAGAITATHPGLAPAPLSGSVRAADQREAPPSPKERAHREHSAALEEKGLVRGSQLEWLEKNLSRWQREYRLFERFLEMLRDEDLELLRDSAYAATLHRIQNKRRSDLKDNRRPQQLKNLAEALHRAPASVLTRLRQVPAFIKAETKLRQQGPIHKIAVWGGE